MINTAKANQLPDSSNQTFLARYQSVFFYILAFGLTWIYWWLIWAPLHLPDILFALGSLGAVIAAFLMLAITSGKSGVLRLLRSLVHWRIGVLWYLLALRTIELSALSARSAALRPRGSPIEEGPPDKHIYLIH